MSDKYRLMDDEQIVEAINGGDTAAMDYLMEKYKNFVRKKARSYFIIGGDNDDMIQEGMIGLFKAVRDYDAGKQASFRVFAEMCVQRQMITAVKASTRKKHTPLNTYISFSKQIADEDNERTLQDIVGVSNELNPEELFIGRENLEYIENKINADLSKLEKQVLSLYLLGISYQEISHRLGKTVKCVDNALQRIKKKLEKYIESRYEL